MENKYLEKIAASALKTFGVSTAIGAGLGGLAGAISGARTSSYNVEAERKNYHRLLRQTHPGIDLKNPEVKAWVDNQIQAGIKRTLLRDVKQGVLVNGTVGALAGGITGASLAFSKGR